MKNKSKGFSLIASIFIMIIFLLLGVTLVSLLAGDVISAARGINFAKASYMTDAAVVYTVNRVLRNDYNWLNNNWGVGDTAVFLPTGYGYPVSASGTFTGEATYNQIQRSMEQQLFMGVFITYVTSVGAGADDYIPEPGVYLDNRPDPHLRSTEQHPWIKSIINPPSGASGSDVSSNQYVYRYICPSLNYAVSASGGGIDFSACGSLTLMFKGSTTATTSVISAGDIFFSSNPSPPMPALFNPSPNPYKAYEGHIPYPAGEIIDPDKIWFPLQVDPAIYNKYKDYDVSGAVNLDGEYNGIVYSAGDVYIGPAGGGTTVTVNGSIIANGNIYIRPNMTLTINENPNLQDAYFPAMVAGGNIVDVGASPGDITINGFVYAGGFIDINVGLSRSITLVGGMAARGNSDGTGIKIIAESLNITYDPKILLTYGIFDNHPGSFEALNNEIRYGIWEEELKFKKKPAP